MRSKFAVMIRGENFYIDYEGERKLVNFVSTRKVKASTIKEAEETAIALVKNDQSLIDLMVENDNHKPMLHVEELWRIPFYSKLGGKGFTFYAETD